MKLCAVYGLVDGKKEERERNEDLMDGWMKHKGKE